jgi:hypothetical protein
MGRPRSLLRSLSVGTVGRRHACKASKDHALQKGDPMLVIKVERDEFHYCMSCAIAYMATARTALDELEAQLNSGNHRATEE